MAGLAASLLTSSIARAQDVEADTADAETPPDEVRYPKVSPYAVFVGGGAVEIIDRRQDDNDTRQNRFWTPAVARVGLAGKLSKRFTLQSEIEFNGGPYGTSVWEGQATIQVRNQLIRYQREGLLAEEDRLRIDVGRITDPASVNFVSLHIANLLLSDPLARFPLLTSGFNRGNGLRVDYTLDDKLTFGLSANAGNPTSTTGTFMIGGSFFPFQRFYEVPWSAAGRDARGFPTASFHTILVSPSILFRNDLVQAQAAAQFFTADVNTNTQSDDAITGRNLRAGFKLTPIDALAVFANGSFILNDIMEETDVTQRADGKFFGVTAGGGFDVYVDGMSGFGVQYDRVREEQRGNAPDVRHHLNAGVTVFVDESVFMSGRFALYQRCQESATLERCDADGARQIMLTLTAVLGPTQDVQP